MHTDPRGGHNRKIIDTNFFKEWSPKMAYVTGLIFADGAIWDARKSSRTCYLSITSKDYDLLNDVRDALSSNHGIYTREPSLTAFPNGKTYMCKREYVLRIGNRTIYSDLVNLGITPRKSLTLKFPQVPNNVLGHFIRGYFDGDGCINLFTIRLGLKPILKTIFTSGSEQFLEKLSNILGKFTRTSNQIIRFQSNAFRLTYRMHDSLKLLKFMYSDLGKAPFLKRKYDIYQKYLLTT